MYRERYDIDKKYTILSREAVEHILAGECWSIEDILSGSFTSGIEEATTALTSIGGSLYQYSVVSNNKSSLPAINAFSSTVKENNIFCREDISVISSVKTVAWMYENAYCYDFRKKFMCNLSFNCGKMLEGFSVDVGKTVEEGGTDVIAGYVISQRKGRAVHIENIILSSSDYTNFVSEFEYFDDTLSVMKQYLIDNSAQFNLRLT